MSKSGLHKVLLLTHASARDSLPYHAEFSRLYREYTETGLPRIDQHNFWLLLLRAGKKGGARQAKKVRLPVVLVSAEEAFELQRLCPESIGARDRLPYTTEFDGMHKHFEEHTDRHLSRNDFWRALSRVAKRSRKPEPVQSGVTRMLPTNLERDLFAMNPWWEGGNQKAVPNHRRTIYNTLYDKLTRNLYRIIGVRARQVGKTTLQSQMIDDLLHKRRLVSPCQILRVQFDDLKSLHIDDPIVTIVDWYERHILKGTINDVAAKHKPVYLFLDEIQDVPTWSPQLKHIVDFKDCQVYITGSSALRIGHGSEGLGGRIDLSILPPLSLVEIAGFRGEANLAPYGGANDVSRWLDKCFWEDLGVTTQANR